jgi:hypothetical protein
MPLLQFRHSGNIDSGARNIREEHRAAGHPNQRIPGGRFDSIRTFHTASV